MKIEIIEHINPTLSKGKVLEVDDKLAKEFIKKGFAKELKVVKATKEKKIKLKTKGKK